MSPSRAAFIKTAFGSLTPPNVFLFYGPFVNLHGANYTICTANSDREIEPLSKLVSFIPQTSDQQSSYK